MSDMKMPGSIAVLGATGSVGRQSLDVARHHGVEVELLTGRTHQIRAHMAHIGHPLVGDGKYGVNRADRAEGYKYQALYSYKLRFSFKGEPTALDYLNGKEFSIPKKDIYFTAEFFER